MRVSREWNWWPINRPHLIAYWIDQSHAGLGVSWGNGNSDPVWLLCVEFYVPRWIERVLP